MGINIGTVSKSIEEQFNQSFKICSQEFTNLRVEINELTKELNNYKQGLLDITNGIDIVALKQENERLTKQNAEYYRLACENKRELIIAKKKLDRLKARILCENADELLEYLVDIIDGSEVV